ncbi:ribbon-helix-helix domain-containing protein [Sphingopyxis sp. 550A]
MRRSTARYSKRRNQDSRHNGGGGRKGDLSRFVGEAVNQEVLHKTARDIQACMRALNRAISRN